MAAFAPTLLGASPAVAAILPYGLTFHSLLVTLPDGTERDLLFGPSTPDDHHFDKNGGRCFSNQTVGRYANRLPSGVTEVQGARLDLPAGNPGVCLHGGANGLDTLDWKLVSRPESTLFPAKDDNFPSLLPSRGEESIFRVVSPAGADGFPLTLEIEGLVQALKPSTSDGLKNASLNVILRAKIVDDGAEGIENGTPVNLTVHWGFNLGSFKGGEDESVLDHKLWINSSRATGMDKQQLATGSLISTRPGDLLNFQQGTWSDASSHRAVGAYPAPNGIDPNIIFDSISSEPQVILSSPDSKVSLVFRSNQSTVQVYTSAHFNGTGERKVHHNAASGKGYEQFGAIFLEFHHPLATFLHPELEKVAGTSTILKKDQVYENSVSVEIVLS